MADNFTATKLAWLDAVIFDPDLSPLSKIVAAAIALRYLNRETGDAWPSIAKLAADVGRGEKQVREAIRGLELRGHLEVAKTVGGSGRTNRMRPTVREKNPPGNETLSEEKPSGKRNPFGNETLSKMNLNPIENEQKPLHFPQGNPIDYTTDETIEGDSPISPKSRLRKSIDASDDFNRFWETYPRKVAKDAARRAFAAAIRKMDPSKIIVGAQRYADERRFEDPKYTKHPATWLNGSCWSDEDRPAHVLPPEARSGGGEYRRAGKFSAMDAYFERAHAETQEARTRDDLDETFQTIDAEVVR